MLNKTDRKFHWAWLSEHNDVLRHDMTVINKLLNAVKGNHFVDLGCFIGGFTAAMARVASKRDGMVYSIDLYKTTIDTPGNFYLEHMVHPCKEYFLENMADEGLLPWIKLKEGCSWEYANDFNDESVDFIWIDADHHYSSVIQDIRAWYPKLKVGGIIAGHDYSDWGVEMAVREFFPYYMVHPTRNDVWSYRRSE